MIPKQLIDMRFNRVRFKDKRAFEKGWQNTPYSYDEISKYFPKENYGVLCGKELRALDDDSPDKKLIKLFIDNFGETFRVRDHFYFKFDNKHQDKIIFFDGNKHLGELQGEGTYVVGAGSTHPSGEIYDVKNDLEIKTISYDKFIEVFGKYIKSKEKNIIVENKTYNEEEDKLIKQIKEKWNHGDRQNLTLSLSGYLRKTKKMGLSNALKIVKQICYDCEDNNFEERKKAVEETYNKDEEKIKGISGLRERQIDLGFKNGIKNLILSRQEDLASEEITNLILQDYYIYTTKDDIKSEIWYYNDGIYIPNGRSLIKEITRNILEDAYTAQRVNKVIVKIEADTQIEHDEFFKNESIKEIPIKNGILNIFTREVSEFTPERIFFNKLPIKYNPESKCNNIIKFFSDILKDESDTNVMFELMGFCLMKEYRFEKSFMFIGDGRNGKGKTLNLIKRFLGVENCSSIPLAQINSGSTSVCELHGRLANIAGDLSNTDLKDTGMFKQITGRDLITAKRKYLNDLFFENYAKIIFACNELPKVYDLSDGFWSRWMLFEFPYKFIKKSEYDLLSTKGNNKIMDESIIDKISTDKELSGLLNMALDGLERILKNRGFSYSKGTEEVKDLWIRKSDSFTAFCIDCVEEQLNGQVLKKDIRRKFGKYCKNHKIPGASDTAIKIVLENKFGAYDSQGSYGDRIWEGIRLK